MSQAVNKEIAPEANDLVYFSRLRSGSFSSCQYRFQSWYWPKNAARDSKNEWLKIKLKNLELTTKNYVPHNCGIQTSIKGPYNTSVASIGIYAFNTPKETYLFLFNRGTVTIRTNCTMTTLASVILSLIAPLKLHLNFN